ncbi:RsmB/NOP family class I SAM-dependent RNA methyltransferase [Yoonia litorea]|uniref:16S rRNA (Cytosine967-C5)-methyltransferase n=1 Tax=Yoonia litorea TaxID=1123755 RepID=A0A1I6M9G2_9RHOB|nr:RsmB/NOP family class I SAM-dependent RNA methyltransferase [Yoonia litorea]SFS12263.1 16S rRNA (cytosine967-C5)-methyltransferase [Yoonia litorea]
MTPGARIAAAIEILDIIAQGAPAERALTTWARNARFAGSKDRAAIRDHVFDALRAKRSLGDGDGRSLMVQLALREGWDVDALFNGEGHAPAAVEAHERHAFAPTTEAARCDVPEWLWPLWVESLGDKAKAAAIAQQNRASVFLRVNLRRASRDEAAAALASDGIGTKVHPFVATCLQVTDNPRQVKQSNAFRDGVVELQDAASQWAVAQVPFNSATRILDFCAGGGGKALAFADLTIAEIYAHDIAPQRLVDLPARAERAGVIVTQVATNQLKDHAPFDIVFCDAPCSGSGTWRRTPDAKWRLDQTRLDDLIQSQGEVLEAAAPLVSDDGLLVYATCSVLSAENHAAVQRFTARFPGWRVETSLQRIPDADGDGFFMAVLAKQ